MTILIRLFGVDKRIDPGELRKSRFDVPALKRRPKPG